eukprot:gene3576-4080_t
MAGATRESSVIFVDDEHVRKIVHSFLDGKTCHIPMKKSRRSVPNKPVKGTPRNEEKQAEFNSLIKSWVSPGKENKTQRRVSRRLEKKHESVAGDYEASRKSEEEELEYPVVRKQCFEVPEDQKESKETSHHKENTPYSITPQKKSKKNEKEEFSKKQTEQLQSFIESQEESPKESPSHRVLRTRKPAVHIQKILDRENQTNEESESDNESVADEDGDSSSDNEIQFKDQDKEVPDSKKFHEDDQKLSRLKAMAEAYFAVHHNKKIVTSDRTLSRLQNAKMTQKELRDRLSECPASHKQECTRLFKDYTHLFPKWIFQLRHGFNILLHGLGSKRRLLDEFRHKMLSDSVHIVINGFFPSLTIKSILNMITEDLLNYSGTFKSITDQCNFIKSEYNSGEVEELFLLVHNIDGQMLRNSKVQNALSYLASSSKIHIIASIDHINAPIIWDQNRSSRFNWLWYDTTTFERYTEETSFENSLLVQQTGSLALSSLTHVLRSLTPNARGIFKLLVDFQLENDNDSNYIGISFSELYQKCREKFLVNSDLTLRAQLTEFRDHKLIKSKKGADGVENLSIPLSSSQLKQFMEENDL